MATAKKLPSGKYRCLIYIGMENGKRKYKSFTADTKKEAELKATQYVCTQKTESELSNDITLYDAMKSYCNIKKSVLSPSTIRGYEQMRHNAFTNIENKKLSELNKYNLQKWINGYSENHSPKSVRNAYGFLNAVIKTYIENYSVHVTLPSKIRYDGYVPNDEEIQMLIKYYSENDTDMLIASCLSAFGTLRRSEICGLNAEHILGNSLQIRQAKVKNSDNQFVIKPFVKNASSVRDIAMPQFIIDLLPKQGYVVSINPDRISIRHGRTLKKLGIQHFRFHDLRHYAASIMHALGVPDQYIMERGGWASDKTLKEIYRGTIDTYNKQFQDITFKHFENMQHEMQHIK